MHRSVAWGNPSTPNITPAVLRRSGGAPGVVPDAGPGMLWALQDGPMPGNPIDQTPLAQSSLLVVVTKLCFRFSF